MIGDGFQYYVRHAWKLSDFDKMLDLGPLIYPRHILKGTSVGQATAWTWLGDGAKSEKNVYLRFLKLASSILSSKKTLDALLLD